jgi:hypothetical protein
MRVDAHQVHRQALGPIQRVLVGLDVAAALVDVELDREVAVLGQREQVVRRVEHRDPRLGLDGPGRDGPRPVHGQAQHRLFLVLIEGEGERLELADDLVHVLDHAGDRLMLVHDAVDADRPHGRAAQRREQQTPHGVAEGVAEAALERLDAELRGMRPDGRHVDERRPHEAAEIDGLGGAGAHWMRPGLVWPTAGHRRPPPPRTRGRLAEEFGS